MIYHLVHDLDGDLDLDHDLDGRSVNPREVSLVPVLVPLLRLRKEAI